MFLLHTSCAPDRSKYYTGQNAFLCRAGRGWHSKGGAQAIVTLPLWAIGVYHIHAHALSAGGLSVAVNSFVYVNGHSQISNNKAANGGEGRPEVDSYSKRSKVYMHTCAFALRRAEPHFDCRRVVAQLIPCPLGVSPSDVSPSDFTETGLPRG